MAFANYYTGGYGGGSGGYSHEPIIIHGSYGGQLGYGGYEDTERDMVVIERELEDMVVSMKNSDMEDTEWIVNMDTVSDTK